MDVVVSISVCENIVNYLLERVIQGRYNWICLHCRRLEEGGHKILDVKYCVFCSVGTRIEAVFDDKIKNLTMDVFYKHGSQILTHILKLLETNWCCKNQYELFELFYLF